MSKRGRWCSHSSTSGWPRELLAVLTCSLFIKLEFFMNELRKNQTIAVLLFQEPVYSEQTKIDLI